MMLGRVRRWPEQRIWAPPSLACTWPAQPRSRGCRPPVGGPIDPRDTAHPSCGKDRMPGECLHFGRLGMMEANPTAQQAELVPWHALLSQNGSSRCGWAHLGQQAQHVNAAAQLISRYRQLCKCRLGSLTAPSRSTVRNREQSKNHSDSASFICCFGGLTDSQPTNKHDSPPFDIHGLSSHH